MYYKKQVHESYMEAIGYARILFHVSLKKVVFCLQF